MRRWILPLLLLVMLALLAWRHADDFPGLIAALDRISPEWLALAIVLQVLTYVSVGICYVVLARSLRARLSLAEATRMSVVNLFVNSAVPSAGLSGNLFLVKMMTSRGMPAGTATFVVLLERVLYFAALAAFVGGLLGWTILRSSTGFEGWHREIAALAGVVALTVGLALATRRMLRSPLATIERVIAIRGRMPHAIAKRINGDELREDARRIEEAGGIAALPKRRLAIAFAAELLLFVLDAATVWALFRGVGSDFAPVRAGLGLGLATLLAQMLVVPGALEVGLAGLLDGLGARTGTALIVTLLFHFLSLWAAMPFGWIFWRRATGRPIPREDARSAS